MTAQTANAALAERLALPTIIWQHQHLRIVAHYESDDDQIMYTVERHDGYDALLADRWVRLDDTHTRDWITLVYALIETLLPVDVWGPGSPDDCPAGEEPHPRAQRLDAVADALRIAAEEAAAVRRALDHDDPDDDPYLSLGVLEKALARAQTLLAQARPGEAGPGSLKDTHAAEDALVDAACDLALAQGHITSRTGDTDEATRALQNAQAALESAARYLGMSPLLPRAQRALDAAQRENGDPLDAF